MTTFTFHGIGTTQRSLEEGEARVWLPRERFETALDIVAAAGARVTFDDSNVSDFEVALPALKARALAATFFVVAGRLGTPGFLSAEQVAALAVAGMRIGSHGLDHVDWRTLDRATLAAHLQRSKALLAAATATEIAWASCPFGSYDRKVLLELRRAGFERVYTSDPGRSHDDSWLQRRTTIPADFRDEELATVASDAASTQTRALRWAKTTAKRLR